MLEVLKIIGNLAGHAAVQNWSAVVQDIVDLAKAVYAVAHPAQQAAIAARFAALGTPAEPIE